MVAGGKKPGRSAKARSSSKTNPKKSKQVMSAKKDTMPENTSVNLVNEIIRKSEDGIDIPTLVEKTGLDDDRICRIVLKLSAQGKITRAGRGRYEANF